jgi:hypothetical protein
VPKYFESRYYIFGVLTIQIVFTALLGIWNVSNPEVDRYAIFDKFGIVCFTLSLISTAIFNP